MTSVIDDLTKTHYLPLAALQMGAVRLASDVVAQSSHAGAFDPQHALAMACTGLCVSGIGGALWLRHLESALGSYDGSQHRPVVAMALADLACWSPIANTANLMLVPLLTGHSYAAAVASAVAGLPSLMQLELCIYGPYNLCGFRWIAPNLRPTAKAMCSFIFGMFLSFSC